MDALLQHELDRFGVVTVQDVMLLDITTKTPLMYLDTLKISNITSEGQTKEIKGGRYADMLLVYNYGRTVNLEFQDALLSYQSMKNLWGAQLQEDATKITTYQREVLTVNASNAVSLTYNGANITKIVNVKDGEEVASANYSQSNKVITFSNNAATDGENVQVFYSAPLVNIPNNSTDWKPIQSLIKSSSFPKTVTFVGKTYIMEQETGKMVEFEIEIPKLKLAADFTLTMEAEGDASVFDFSGMALVTADRELIKLKAIKYEPVV